MKSTVKTAVILAAGLGSRLGDLKENKPKAFLHIGGETLIERSIELLISKGIDSIVIGTGYGSEYFDELRNAYPQISTHRNAKFDSTGSMYTLYLLRDLISEPFLLLEGDLLYEVAALDKLLEDAEGDIILASDATHSGDEVYIECNSHQQLLKMSKNKSALDAVCGELVGISKLSINTLQEMIKFAESRYVDGEMNIHYEDALVGIAGVNPLLVKVVKDLAWCEIDDASHLERAVSVVYPRIQALEGT